MLIVFEDKITEMLSDKSLYPTVIGLFIREKKFLLFLLRNLILLFWKILDQIQCTISL